MMAKKPKYRKTGKARPEPGGNQHARLLGTHLNHIFPPTVQPGVGHNPSS